MSDCGNGRVDLGEQCDGVDDSGCPGTCNTLCHCPPVTTINIPSSAAPPNTPDSPGVTFTNEQLLTQFGPDLNLNNARYTRFQLDDSDVQPDAIIILIPGFLGGAANFRQLAQNLLVREKADHNLRLECGPSIAVPISSRTPTGSTSPKRRSTCCSPATGCSARS